MGEEQQKKVDRVIKRHFYFAPGFKIFWLNGGVCGQCLYGESLNGWKRGNEGGSRADCGEKIRDFYISVLTSWCADRGVQYRLRGKMRHYSCRTGRNPMRICNS